MRHKSERFKIRLDSKRKYLCYYSWCLHSLVALCEVLRRLLPTVFDIVVDIAYPIQFNSIHNYIELNCSGLPTNLLRYWSQIVESAWCRVQYSSWFSSRIGIHQGDSDCIVFFRCTRSGVVYPVSPVAKESVGYVVDFFGLLGLNIIIIIVFVSDRNQSWQFGELHFFFFFPMGKQEILSSCWSPKFKSVAFSAILSWIAIE